MKPVPQITHRKQEKPYSCGAASIAMLFNAPESLIRSEVNTTSYGTSPFGVQNFLDKLEVTSFQIHLNKPYEECIADLAQTSFKFPIYCGSEYRDRYFVKGRDRERQHAILICDGLIYDPSCNKAMLPEEYLSVFNKSLTVKHIIIIDSERPNFLKNSLDEAA